MDFSRSILTVNVDSPTWKYGRHRRSMLINLLENTVEIDSWYWFTYLKIRLISHRQSISEKNQSKSTVDVDSYQKNRLTVFFRKVEKKDHWPMVPYVVRNGPGHTSTKNSWSHVWWEMVPRPIQILTPIHWFIDPFNQSRSISTVDTDLPTGEYGWYWKSMPIHLRRITVDRWLSIKNRHNFVVDLIDDTCAWFIGSGSVDTILQESRRE